VYIVKDTWRNDRRDLEGKLYAQIGACGGVAKIYSYGIVQIDGQDDTTAKLIRCKLESNGPPRRIDAIQPFADTASNGVPVSSPDIERHGVTQYTNAMDFLPVLDVKDVDKAIPRGRTHLRLVVETYGWPIKYAKSPIELVATGHVVISAGNIIQVITGKLEPGDRGVLIDHDNAILLGEKYTPLLDDAPSVCKFPFCFEYC
jgi:hypothetical protein